LPRVPFLSLGMGRDRHAAVPVADAAPLPSARQSFALGLARWSADRLIAADLDYYRLSIRAARGEYPARWAAITAAVHAQVFAESLSDDLGELMRLNFACPGILIAEAASDRIAAARLEIAATEEAAGRAVPRVPLACAGNLPWMREGDRDAR
jgi:hypothetical protein